MNFSEEEGQQQRSQKDVVHPKHTNVVATTTTTTTPSRHHLQLLNDAQNAVRHAFSYDLRQHDFFFAVEVGDLCYDEPKRTARRIIYFTDHREISIPLWTFEERDTRWDQPFHSVRRRTRHELDRDLLYRIRDAMTFHSVEEFVSSVFYRPFQTALRDAKRNSIPFVRHQNKLNRKRLQNKRRKYL